MKVLAILQNQWFRDPDRVRAFIERRPELRRNFIRRALFSGCRTGRILKTALGEEWCRKIVWEEASPEIGGQASSRFRADTRHILDVVVEVQPTVILALGKIASDAVNSLCPIHRLTPPATIINIITAPHPTARGMDTLRLLRDVRALLDKMV
ncbi:MAG TPA: hypothetical protein VK512_07695 [Xanthobacteraceae bacterium]|nr:hypothetical protein [Xanthobacteraceae bacterium]